ncbi:uncharacterized protein LOC141851020 [Brevipalpus obovatus]|uniref:uncharacterized protein LOC141851020 n=1 Tax=Brevipalpus obovatus TaxID=246614 RepID=UPI003D9E5AB5
MGCGPMIGASKVQMDENLLEEIQVSTGSINVMDISEDRSLLFLGDDRGIGYLLSSFSKPVEMLGKLVGHKAGITCSTISGLYVYTGSIDNSIRKWSIETMECIYTYQGHESKVNRLIFRGNLLFSTSYDKTAKVWLTGMTDEMEEVVTANLLNPCLRTLKGHTKSVYPVIFIPLEISFTNSLINERDLVVTGSVDCTIRIWSLKYSECLKVLTDHSGPIYNIILDPMNSTQFISSAGDGMILCWDSITGEILHTMKGHQGPVISIYAHKRILFSGSADKTARAWVLEFGQCTRVFENTAGVAQIQYYNGMVSAGLSDGKTNIFDSKSGVLKESFPGNFEVLTGLKCAGQRVFTCGISGKLCVWDTSGIQDDTIFGKRVVEEIDEEDDSEDVKTAIRVVDKYFRH